MQKIEVNYIAISTHKKSDIEKNAENGIIRIESKNIIGEFFKILYKSKIENVVKTRNRHKASGEITFKSQKYKYFFNTKSDEFTYFSLRTEKSPSKKIIENMEELCNIIKEKLKNKYIIVTTNDGMSEYYCNMLYDKINKFERQLRQLLYNIYIKFFGKEYINYIKGILSTENIEKIKRTMGKKNENEQISQFLYNLEYNDLEKILFTPRWTETEEKNREELLDNVNTLNKEEIKERVKLLEPKSDWKRLFEEKSNIDMNININEIRKYRNTIAHSRLINTEEYNICNKLIIDINKKLSIAIKETLEEEFHIRNFEILAESIQEFAKTLQEVAEVGILRNEIQNISNSLGISEGMIKSITNTAGIQEYARENLVHSLGISEGMIKSITNTARIQEYARENLVHSLGTSEDMIKSITNTAGIQEYARESLVHSLGIPKGIIKNTTNTEGNPVDVRKNLGNIEGVSEDTKQKLTEKNNK